ncbi:hypothetical protein ABK040_005451 [Willaertia magna]
MPYFQCLGVATLDYLSLVDEFPKSNSKCRTKQLLMQGGGNAANVSVGLSKFKVPNSLISKIGNDIIGKQIIEELKKEDNLDLSLMTVSNSCNSSFSYIIISKNNDVDNNNTERSIINTPMTESLTFSEWIKDNSHTDTEKFVDILFLDGRFSGFALDYLNFKSISIGFTIMECERMRNEDLKENETFCKLISKVNAIFCSENFPNEYLTIKKELNRDILFAMHLLYSNLHKPSISSLFPSFVLTTIGDKGSICLIKTEDNNLPFIEQFSQLSLSTSVDSVPLTQCFRMKINDSIIDNNELNYLVIYCQGYKDSSKVIVDTTGAGDSFHSAFLFGLYFMTENLFSCKNLTKLFETLMKFSSIMAFETCTGIGARITLPTREYAEETLRKLLENNINIK